MSSEEPLADPAGAEGRADQAVILLELYDTALPEVYGYLVARCPSATLAEDLCAETFLAAVAAVRAGTVPRLTTAWLITVARNKLVDHWRRLGREERTLVLAHDADPTDDPWDAVIDRSRAMATLTTLGPHHQAALALRYLDGLPVAKVAEQLDRTVHATEALLVRARTAFRRAYTEGGDDDA
jgi:RNA polymerase sigma-70 factor, ECF subfamily